MNKGRAELLQTVMEKMRNVMKCMHSGHAGAFTEFGIGKPHMLIMIFLSKRKEGVAVKDLASFLSVTSGAVTQFIDGLVEKKLVQREEDAKDRRVLRIKLSEFGVQKLSQFKKDFYKSSSPAFDALSEKELEQFIALLEKVKMGRD